MHHHPSLTLVSSSSGMERVTLIALATGGRRWPWHKCVHQSLTLLLSMHNCVERGVGEGVVSSVEWVVVVEKRVVVDNSVERVY